MAIRAIGFIENLENKAEPRDFGGFMTPSDIRHPMRNAGNATGWNGSNAFAARGSHERCHWMVLLGKDGPRKGQGYFS